MLKIKIWKCIFRPEIDFLILKPVVILLPRLSDDSRQFNFLVVTALNIVCTRVISKSHFKDRKQMKLKSWEMCVIPVSLDTLRTSAVIPEYPVALPSLIFAKAAVTACSVI